VTALAGTLAGTLRRALPAVTVAVPPRVRRWLLWLAAASLAIGSLYMLWFRDSTFVSVEKVTVTGLTSKDAKTLRRSLVAAASSMTTLHVDHERLDQVVAGYPVVRDLRVSTDFPHALRIEVVEHHPAAMAVAGGSRVPVAGDGTVLRGLPVHGKLPELKLKGALPPERLSEPRALRLARVAGGAPAALSSRLANVHEEKERGIVVEMREGPLLIFGALSRVSDKWAAAARVLADPQAKGATYIDVRLPERPAAGGVAAETLAPLPPASAGTVTPLEGATATPAAETGPGAAPAEPGASGEGPGAAEQAPATQQAPAGSPQSAPPAPQTAPQQPSGRPAPAAPQAQPGTGGGAVANPQP
jgi:cell division protein FtsQ